MDIDIENYCIPLVNKLKYKKKIARKKNIRTLINVLMMFFPSEARNVFKWDYLAFFHETLLNLQTNRL